MHNFRFKVQSSKFKVLLILLAFSLTALSQENDSLRDVKKNVGIVLGTEAALYAGSMTGLYYLWYASYDQSPFHLHNDNNNWLQMDKAGHAASAYFIGALGYETLRLAGSTEGRH